MDGKISVTIHGKNYADVSQISIPKTSPEAGTSTNASYYYTEDDTAQANDIVYGLTAHTSTENSSHLAKVTGTLQVIATESQTHYLETRNQSITLDRGVYRGTQTIRLKKADKEALTEHNLRSGVTILGVTGDFTNNATATAADMTTGKTAYVAGELVTGTMPNNGAVSGVIETKTGYVTIPAGYTTGGTVSISAAEALKIQSGNIRKNVTLLGVTGDSNVVNTSTATATAADIAIGKTAYVQGQMVTGTNPGGTGGHDYELITGEWYTYSGTYYNDEVETIRFGMAYDAELPNVTNIYAYGFCYDKTCGKLKCQKLEYIHEYAFFGNINIEEIEAGALIEIGTAAFRNAQNFEKLVITRTDGVATLAASIAFANTKISQGTGYIYVPDALLSNYKAATNWSTYANQIKGLSEL